MFESKQFYQQYDAVEWSAQMGTHLNRKIYERIIAHIKKNPSTELSLFDMGFGVGYFLSMLYDAFKDKYNHLLLAGCEPARKSYDYFVTHAPPASENKLSLSNDAFLEVHNEQKFDFVTAIYVLPNFSEELMPSVVRKICSLLKSEGEFIFATTQFQFIEQAISRHPSRVLKDAHFEYNGSLYRETLHWTELPGVGRIKDYNRERRYYLDLFKNGDFDLLQIEEFESDGFPTEIYYFQKNKHG